MADCAKYRILLSGLADDALTAAEKSEIEAHLEGCPKCRALLSAYQSIAREIEESEAEPPEAFAAGVIQKIKALKESPAPEEIKENPESAAVRPRKRSIRPVIISFVAAAACLALVFMVSPQLFQFAGGSKSASVAENATAASSAPMAAQAQEPAEDAVQYETKWAADSGAGLTEDGQNDPGSQNDQAFGTVTSGADSTPELLTGTEMAPVSPAATSEQQTNSTTDGDADQRSPDEYYAVITIKGQLPDVLINNAQMSNSDGTFNIEVTADVAKQLINDGYPAEMGDAEKVTALVVYAPS